jgi:hypothetical protein
LPITTTALVILGMLKILGSSINAFTDYDCTNRNKIVESYSPLEVKACAASASDGNKKIKTTGIERLSILNHICFQFLRNTESYMFSVSQYSSTGHLLAQPGMSASEIPKNRNHGNVTRLECIERWPWLAKPFK